MHQNKQQNIANSSRIRSIHQMSMVPTKRSVFSGNWSMPLAINAARCPLLMCRNVSASNDKQHSHNTAAFHIHTNNDHSWLKNLCIYSIRISHQSSHSVKWSHYTD